MILIKLHHLFYLKNKYNLKNGVKMYNVIIFIILCVFIRLSPHPWNFTPILSIALLTGAYFKDNRSFVIPLSIILISDFYIGNFSMSFWVYGSYLLIFLLGKKYLTDISYNNIIVSSFLGSLIFFIITNFGTWIIGYPKTIQGIISCFTLALPFYKNTLLSSLFYSSILFAIYEIILRINAKLNIKKDIF